MSLRSLFVMSVFLFGSTIFYAQQTINATLEHDSLTREYIIYLPADYSESEKLPMVFNFHGFTSDAVSQMFYGDFREIADREKFIVVHPQGTVQQASGETYWNAQWDDGPDDIGFTAALIDSMIINYEVNENRVYSTGMSNGGFMSYTLACELSDKIAAIASVTGTMTTLQVSTLCDSENTTPIMEIHGTADAVVPYGGDGNFMAPVDNVIDYWVENMNCNATPFSENLADSNMGDGSTVERYVYSSCDEDSSVELLKVIGGGHTWPGSAFVFGSTNLDINASEEIWRFFSQYELDGLISSDRQLSVEVDELAVFPVPAYDQLQLQFSSDSERSLRVYGVNGNLLLTKQLYAQSESIDIDSLAPGIYYLLIETGDHFISETFAKE